MTNDHHFCFEFNKSICNNVAIFLQQKCNTKCCYVQITPIANNLLPSWQSNKTITLIDGKFRQSSSPP